MAPNRSRHPLFRQRGFAGRRDHTCVRLQTLRNAAVGTRARTIDPAPILLAGVKSQARLQDYRAWVTTVSNRQTHPIGVRALCCLADCMRRFRSSQWGVSRGVSRLLMTYLML